jgi:AraC-like DNA-binding protein
MAKSFTPRRCLFRLIGVIICAFILTPAYAQTEQAAIDSLLQNITQTEGLEKLKTYNKYCLATYTSYTPEEMMPTIDAYIAEADRQKELSHQASARSYKLIVLYNAGEVEEFFTQLPDIQTFYYQNGHEQDNFLMVRYYSTVRMANEFYLLRNQSETAIRRAREIYEQAAADNDIYGLSMLSFCLGKGYETSKRAGQADEYYREALNYANEIDNEARRVAMLQDICLTLGRNLINQQAFEEALSFCEEWEGYVEEYRLFEQNNFGSDDNHFLSLLDYTLVKIRTLAGLHRFDEIEPHMDVIHKARERGLTPWEPYIVEALFEQAYHAEAYDEALRLVDSLIDFHKERAFDPNTVNLLEKKAHILEALGDYKQSAALYSEVILMTDSITNYNFTAQLHDLQTIYEVDKITAEKERNRMYFLFALIGCLLLLAALVIWILYSRRLQAKNRALYEQIQKQQERAKAESLIIEQIPARELSREMQLFIALKDLLMKDNAYLNPNLDRQELIRQLGTNERYLIDAVHTGSGTTIANYIGSLRLQYALELLHNSPELSLDAIAIDSGHTSYSTFFRAFTKAYGMSPTEYKRLTRTKEISR